MQKIRKIKLLYTKYHCWYFVWRANKIILETKRKLYPAFIRGDTLYFVKYSKSTHFFKKIAFSRTPCDFPYIYKSFKAIAKDSKFKNTPCQNFSEIKYNFPFHNQSSKYILQALSITADEISSHARIRMDIESFFVIGLSLLLI